MNDLLNDTYEKLLGHYEKMPLVVLKFLLLIYASIVQNLGVTLAENSEKDIKKELVRLQKIIMNKKLEKNDQGEIGMVLIAMNVIVEWEAIEEGLIICIKEVANIAFRSQTHPEFNHSN